MGISSGVDDRGMYRIWGLPPGEYFVQAGATSVVGSDLLETTQAELDWAAQQLQPASSAAAARQPAAGGSITFVPCYYPGTADESQAVPVVLRPGEERSGIDITSGMVRSSAIHGTVIGVDGQPAGGQVRLVLGQPTSRTGALAQVVPSFGPEPGQFRIGRVPPGDYVLVARAADASAAAPPPSVSTAPGTPPPPGGPARQLPLWATVDVSVGNGDVNDIAVRLQHGMAISGRVVVEGQTAPAPTPAGLSIAPVAAPGVLAGPLGALGTRVSPDGSFVISGLPAYRFRLDVSGVQAPWVARSAVVDGVDALDAYIDVRPGRNLDNVVVTLTDKPTEVSGTLRDGSGATAPGYVLVAFPVDRQHWGQNSRRVRFVRSATNGSFTFTALPAGDYFLCAVAELEPAQLEDVRLLEVLAGGSLRFSLREGERKTQDFRLGG
jgi:hypothetical protein